MGTVNGSTLKRMLLSMALNSKYGELQKGVVRRNTIWDTLIFKKVQVCTNLHINLNKFLNSCVMTNDHCHSGKYGWSYQTSRCGISSFKWHCVDLCQMCIRMCGKYEVLHSPQRFYFDFLSVLIKFAHVYNI